MKLKIVTLIFVLAMAANFSFAQDFYLGVGTPSDPQGTSCATCHSSSGIADNTPYYDSWKLTKHAQAYDSLSGTLNYSCLQCHTTGWNTAVKNGGADEYVKADTSQKHGYSITDAAGFNRTKNIGCEDCHGPLGDSSGTLPSIDHWGFLNNGTTNVPSVAASVCGSCHSGSHNPYLDEWQLSVHASSTSGNPTITNVVIKNKSCVRCHVAQNFISYIKNPSTYRDTILVTGANIQPITCAACHDPHSAANEKQLRMAVTNKAVICDACHSVYLDSVNVKTAVHEDNGPALDGAATFGYRYPGQTYSNSAHTFAATKRCITCHVYASTTGGVTNTGHTFEPRVAACATCHPDYYTNVDTSNFAKRFDYDGVQTTTDSLMAVLQAKLNKASHSDSTSMTFLEANYNLGAVSGDGSHGVHNTRLEQKLLTDAIANFTPSGVSDVKNNNTLPITYSLSQNYPNPFNPTTTIDFSIPEAGSVKITVYDALGKQITTLVNSFMNRGNYKATWNAVSYASGVYFYRIEAKNFLMVKKMVLLK